VWHNVSLLDAFQKLRFDFCFVFEKLMKIKVAKHELGYLYHLKLISNMVIEGHHLIIERFCKLAPHHVLRKCHTTMTVTDT